MRIATLPRGRPISRYSKHFEERSLRHMLERPCCIIPISQVMTALDCCRCRSLHAVSPRFLLLLLVTSFAYTTMILPSAQSLPTRSPLLAPSTTSTRNLQSLSSADLSRLTLLNNYSVGGDDDCYEAALEPRLKIARTGDCLQAALQILHAGSLTRPIIYTRRSTRGIFPLPKTLQYGTCVISVDVMQDSDEDKFPLSMLHRSALELVMACVGGASHVGGKTFVGPKKLVYVLVLGRTSPPAPVGGEVIQVPPGTISNDTWEVA